MGRQAADLRPLDVSGPESARRQAMARLTVATDGPGFYRLDLEIDRWLAGIGAEAGLLTAFVRHTSASLTIQENADPDVLRDLGDALDRLAPRDLSYRHHSEGPDDMPAHIRSMLTATGQAVPVIGGAMDLGTWQSLYLVEHRDRPRQRTLTLHYLGR